MHRANDSPGRYAERLGGASTWYADDLAFGLPTADRHAVHNLPHAARRASLRPHPSETKILRRHQRQVICGLVVNDTLNLPRETRRKLRAALHRRKTAGAATLTDEQLRGWAGVLAMVARGRGSS